MRVPSLTVVAAGFGVVGVALLVFEAVQARRAVVLANAGTAILFVGLGLLAIAAVLVAITAWAEAKELRPPR